MLSTPHFKIVLDQEALFIITAQELECPAVTVYQRSDWGAAPVEEGCINKMATPVTYWFLHHTATSFCKNFTECSAEMREIQRFHQEDRGMSILNVQQQIKHRRIRSLLW